MTEKKQASVLMHFIRGESLTVGECWRLYKTSELRRIVSRLNKSGCNIVGTQEPGQDYKRYRMVAVCYKVRDVEGVAV